MALRGYKRGALAKTFEQELLAARKKAGRQIGGKIVGERKRIQLRTATARRKKAVRYSINPRNGTLVLADYAPLAVAQEYGKTITSTHGKMVLPLDKGSRPAPGEKGFVRKSKSGADVLFSTERGKKPIPIAILRKSITIRRNDKTGRFC